MVRIRVSPTHGLEFLKRFSVRDHCSGPCNGQGRGDCEAANGLTSEV